MHDVLSPFTFARGQRTVRNRCLLAALTNKQSHDDGTISKEEHRWLTRRAQGGFGIVTTAAANVTETGKGWEGELGVYDEAHVPGLRNLANELRNHGALSLVQLFHGGIRAPTSLTGVQPITASTTPLEGDSHATAREMTAEEVEATVEAFGRAAKRCEEAGMDGVELHGAHGYLIAQFLTRHCNRRTDAWGLAEDPIAFLRAIVHRVREVTSPDFLVGVRLSPKMPQLDFAFQDGMRVLDAVVDLDLDFIHVSCWDIHETAEHNGVTLPMTRHYAHAIDQRVPLITTGGVWSADDAHLALEMGADLVGVGRVGIAHPDWPVQLARDDQPIQRPPFTAQHLAHASLSPTFIEYMRRWDGFVGD